MKQKPLTQFVISDATDRAHCVALAHEFFRCEDAFRDFERHASSLIVEPNNKHIAYSAYNAYARFLHSLYEFSLGAIARDKRDTDITELRGAKRAAFLDRCIHMEAQRILDGVRLTPNVSNAHLPERIPKGFVSDLRNYRNKTSGHVAFERAEKLSLSLFYEKYHPLVYMLYRKAAEHWSLVRQDSFPDLGEITKFTVLINSKK